MQLVISRQIFEENAIQNNMRIRLEAAELFTANGQTGIHVEANIRFS